MIKEILDRITKSGYEAYIVGGYVRDYLQGIPNNDIDIITNASKETLIKLFPNAKEVKDYESIHIIMHPYNIDITRYRKEYNLVNGIPSKIEYIDDFKLDSVRRDFTINSLYLDKDLKLVDPFGYKKDLDNKLIKVIGDTKEKFDEDPLRILRAIRLSITLDFELDKDIIDYLNNYTLKISEIKPFKARKELDKIFTSNNIEKFIKYAKKYELDKYLELNIDNLKINDNLLSIYKQIDYNKKYLTNREIKEVIS